VTPLLSVVIVAYRSRDELPACLASIPSTLLGRPVEVAVVNNSRGDGVADWARVVFPAVRILEPGPNLGFGRANNLGFRETTGEMVLFLNPDTICTAAALEHCARRVLDDPGIGLLSPKLALADGSMDLACRRSIPTLWDGFSRATGLAAAFPGSRMFAGYNLSYLPVDATYDVGAINGAFMLGMRRHLNAIAGPAGAVFDENFFMYGDDLDLCIRMGKSGRRVVYDGRVQIVHLKGLSVAREYDAMARAIFDANRDVYLKHFNPRKSSFVRLKYVMAFGLWKRVALLRARLKGHRKVRPV
jgi:hypothetical protein